MSQSIERLDWPADKVERCPVAQLVPAARNARTHSEERADRGLDQGIRLDGSGPYRRGGKADSRPRAGAGGQDAWFGRHLPAIIAQGWSEPRNRPMR
jgi:hypothetical protein